MFNPKKFVEDNQIVVEQLVEGEVIKRVWYDSYGSDLYLIFVSGKFAIIHAINGYEDGAEIDFHSLHLGPHEYYMLKHSKLVSESEFDEWYTHKRAVDTDIEARQKEINERTMLADLKKKYE